MWRLSKTTVLGLWLVLATGCRESISTPLCDRYDSETVTDLYRALPDLDGDGTAELVFYGSDALAIRRGPLPGEPLFAIAPLATTLIRMDVGDLNGDGQTDVVVATPWDSRVMVFFGPWLAGAQFQPADASVTIEITSEGLLNRFGLDVVVGDITGDGIDDLLVGAGAEREESCEGTEDARLFAGPLGAGQLGPDDVSAAVDSTFDCLADPAQILGGALILGRDRGATVVSLPDAELAQRTDIDFASDSYRGAFAVGNRYGLLFDDGIRYSDGAEVELVASQDVSLAGIDGIPFPLAILRQQGLTQLAAMERELADPTQWRRLGAIQPGTTADFLSAGDVDGDGRLDLVAGDGLQQSGDATVFLCR